MSNSPGTDQAVGKDRKRSAHWSEADTKILIGVLLNHHETSRTADNGFKPEVWKEAASLLQQATQLGGPKTPEACKSRWQRLQREYKAAKEAEAHVGFSWDATTHRITASADAWEKLEKPDVLKYQKIHLPCYDDLGLLCPAEPRLRPRGKARQSMGSLSDCSMISIPMHPATSIGPNSGSTSSTAQSNFNLSQQNRGIASQVSIGDSGMPDGTGMMDGVDMNQHHRQHQHQHSQLQQHPQQTHQTHQEQQQHHHQPHQHPPSSQAQTPVLGQTDVRLGMVNGISSLSELAGMVSDHGMHVGPKGHSHGHNHSHNQHSRAPSSGQPIHLGHLTPDPNMMGWGDKSTDEDGERDYNNSFGLGNQSYAIRQPQQAIHTLLRHQGHPSGPSTASDLVPPTKRMRTMSGSALGPGSNANENPAESGGGSGNGNIGDASGGNSRHPLPPHHATPCSQSASSSAILPNHPQIRQGSVNAADGWILPVVDHGVTSANSSRSAFPLLDVQSESLFTPLNLDALNGPDTSNAPNGNGATVSGGTRYNNHTTGPLSNVSAVGQQLTTPTAELTLASLSDAQRRTEAIIRLEREDLSQDEMIRCLKEFERRIAAVDTYLAIRGQPLRSAWLKTIVERG